MFGQRPFLIGAQKYYLQHTLICELSYDLPYIQANAHKGRVCSGVNNGRIITLWWIELRGNGRERRGMNAPG
jgi:hypothetical protein